MANEIGWNSLLGLVRVDQSPYESLEVGWFITWRSFEDAFFHKEITSRISVPDDWFLFSKAST
jgi:hypothetical protein